VLNATSTLTTHLQQGFESICQVLYCCWAAAESARKAPRVGRSSVDLRIMIMIMIMIMKQKNSSECDYVRNSNE
jgi:hypothetical protein